jgi:hypothetical protein
MKKLVFISIISCAIFLSCKQSKPEDKIVVVGENIDSAAIATDTTQQIAIDNSYEFFKSIPVSGNLVYDVIAYGGPRSEGEYAIIRRNTAGTDTVAHNVRYGTIADVYVADLNKNNLPELYVIFQSADSLKKETPAVYEMDNYGKSINIKTTGYNKAEKAENYRGHDSIYIQNEALVRQFPVYNKSGNATCIIKARYSIVKNELLLTNTEAVKNIQ